MFHALVPWASSGPVKLFLAEGLALPGGLVTVGYVSRALGPEHFGRFTLALAFVTVAEAFLAALLTDAGNKTISDAEDWRGVGKTVTRVLLLASSATGLLLYLAAGPIAGWLAAGELAGALRLFAVEIPLFGLAFAHRILLVGTGRFTECASSVTGRWITRVAFVLVFVAISPRIESAILGFIGSTAVEFLILRHFVKPRLLGRLGYPVAPLAKLMVPLFLASMSVFLLSNADLVILSWLGASPDSVGFYGGAQRLALVTNVLVIAVPPVLLSTLARAARLGYADIGESIVRLAMGAALLLIPLAAIIGGAGKQVAELVLGRAYGPAGPLLLLLLGAALLRVIIIFGIVMVVAAGSIRWTYVTSFVLLPIALAGYGLAVPRYGAAGAATVTLGVSVLGAGIMVFAVYRVWGVAPPIISVLASTGISAIAYWASSSWPAEGLALVAKLALLGMLIPAGFVLCGAIKVTELRRLTRSLPTLTAGWGEAT